MMTNPYGGYLDVPDYNSQGPGWNQYGGYIGMLAKQREAAQKGTYADAMTKLRQMIASMPSAQQQLPQAQPQTQGYLPSDDIYDPDTYAKGTAGIESGGDYSIVNPKSGAGGKYQFIEPTWQGLMKQGVPLTPEGRTSSSPEGVQQQELAFRELSKQNAKILKEALGRAPTHAELYAAHLLGPGYASSVIRNRETPIEALVPDSFVKANPMLRGVDGGTFLQQIGRKFNP